jgi:hypothetical protein
LISAYPEEVEIAVRVAGLGVAFMRLTILPRLGTPEGWLPNSIAGVEADIAVLLPVPFRKTVAWV